MTNPPTSYTTSWDTTNPPGSGAMEVFPQRIARAMRRRYWRRTNSHARAEIVGGVASPSAGAASDSPERSDYAQLR